MMMNSPRRNTVQVFQVDHGSVLEGIFSGSSPVYQQEDNNKPRLVMGNGKRGSLTSTSDHKKWTTNSPAAVFEESGSSKPRLMVGGNPRRASAPVSPKKKTNKLQQYLSKKKNGLPL
ncbi:expressed unknown protein [Seminavis robusta]|uniref:Uncharacterized protein n=1 Tax=Seminavis robusta TaxID=568900 RepID=A0A9N8E4D5_9STRA|nr:expressed unknown protein [Seminavis robusta]|eukprot:Sro510_g157280.1 n/a (117) ;mRNA; r:37242-37592